VLPCDKRRPHDHLSCPYVHPGEKARRRDPRTHQALTCPGTKRSGRCSRGSNCPYAHGVFELWLHPARYRTQLCTDGTGCARTVCFFAHTPEQLRAPTSAVEALEGSTLGLGLSLSLSSASSSVAAGDLGGGSGDGECGSSTSSGCSAADDRCWAGSLSCASDSAGSGSPRRQVPPMQLKPAGQAPAAALAAASSQSSSSSSSQGFWHPGDNPRAGLCQLQHLPCDLEQQQQQQQQQHRAASLSTGAISSAAPPAVAGIWSQQAPHQHQHQQHAGASLLSPADQLSGLLQLLLREQQPPAPAPARQQAIQELLIAALTQQMLPAAPQQQVEASALLGQLLGGLGQLQKLPQHFLQAGLHAPGSSLGPSLSSFGGLPALRQPAGWQQLQGCAVGGAAAAPFSLHSAPLHAGGLGGAPAASAAWPPSSGAPSSSPMLPGSFGLSAAPRWVLVTSITVSWPAHKRRAIPPTHIPHTPQHLTLPLARRNFPARSLKRTRPSLLPCRPAGLHLPGNYPAAGLCSVSFSSSCADASLASGLLQSSNPWQGQLPGLGCSLGLQPQQQRAAPLTFAQQPRLAWL
jgi:hypothetical protein